MSEGICPPDKPVTEDDGYRYGVGNGGVQPLVDLRDLAGTSSLAQSNGAYSRNPATPETATVKEFRWETISAEWAPVPGTPHGLALTPDHVIVPLARTEPKGAPQDKIAFVDLDTMEGITSTAGSGPRAVGLSDIVLAP